jgi:hypothetical protein
VEKTTTASKLYTANPHANNQNPWQKKKYPQMTAGGTNHQNELGIPKSVDKKAAEMAKGEIATTDFLEAIAPGSTNRTAKMAFMDQQDSINSACYLSCVPSNSKKLLSGLT